MSIVKEMIRPMSPALIITLGNLPIKLVEIRINGISKFSFAKEFFGFSYCLVRAFLHRKKIISWF
jgi:hypothetical protein